MSDDKTKADYDESIEVLKLHNYQAVATAIQKYVTKLEQGAKDEMSDDELEKELEKEAQRDES